MLTRIYGAVGYSYYETGYSIYRSGLRPRVHRTYCMKATFAVTIFRQVVYGELRMLLPDLPSNRSNCTKVPDFGEIYLKRISSRHTTISNRYI